MKSESARLLELPERKSLPTLIYDRLEAMILSGQLKPGDPINEKALSDSNGFSRAPIREACRRLEQAGLVEIIVNRGAYVKTISRRTAGELCDLRVLLAVHAARLAAERARPEEIAKVSRLMEAIERAARRGKLADFYQLNYDFHLSIIEAGGNQRLTESYAAMSKELNLFRWRALRGGTHLEESIAAHRAIVTALERHDADALATRVENHLREVNRRLMESGIADD